jgi:hypothetical protein
MTRKKKPGTNKLPPAATKRRTDNVIRLLKGGLPAKEVAKKVKLSDKRVFDLAREHKLPTNAPINSGSELERQIYEASHVCTVTELSRIYRQAPINISKLLLRCNNEMKTWKRKALKDAA